MPQNKVIYSPELDYTYIMSLDGKKQIGGMEGDQTKNPLAWHADTPDVDSPITQQTIGDHIKQFGKDLVVNSASQVPMMIPGVGLPTRLASSLLAGYLTDRGVNPDKTQQHSIEDATINTGLGGLLEGLVGGTVKFKMPEMPHISASGSGFWRGVGINAKGISPLYLDSTVVRPGSQMFDELNSVPDFKGLLKIMGVKGAVSNVKRDTALEAIQAMKKKILIDNAKKLIVKNFIPGVAGNTAFDELLNNPQ